MEALSQKGTIRSILRPELLAIFLFFIPKLNLLSVGSSETAGIRIDDLLLAAVAAYLLARWLGWGSLVIDGLVWSCLLVVLVFSFSNLLNLGHSSFFYSVRMLEYLVFLWVGQAYASAGNFQRTVKWLLAINCALILLQALHLLGAFTAEGYQAQVLRPSGLANHPAEMGAWLNLMFAAVVFGGKSKVWRWSVVVLIAIFLTGSRISLLAHCVLIFLYVYRSSSSKSSILLRTAIVSGLLVAAIALIPNPVSKRSAETLSPDNLSAAKAFYNALPIQTQFTEYSNAIQPDNAPESVDPSWWMRLVKWTQVFKLYANSSYLVKFFGIGPGALGPALDGGWLRILAESGLAGLFVYVAMLRKIAKLSAACSMAVVALCVNMLMIDSHIAYKVMSFLFFMAGYTYSRNEQAMAQLSRVVA